MIETHKFVRVDFFHFKAFDSFTLYLRQFNILVGPNNAGKSTILAAFRILSSAIRRASTRNPTFVIGPNGNTMGYAIDLTMISVAEENIFYNYDDSEAATVTFTLSNENKLILYFPEQGACSLILEVKGKSVRTTSAFRSNFNCEVGFVPILGPVEHHEPLFEKEAARLALYNYRAARNFRNIWYHYPERFDEFRTTLSQTWHGMDIERPKVDYSFDKPRLHMFCPENRIPREIFWAGFGFQVWCQMLTHLIQSSDKAIFLIDEPDIYLHSDLQRQLLGLLRKMGSDILIATHSTEIITEAEADDIVFIDKHRKKARRLKNSSQLEEVFKLLGSSINPTLTQLAKTRRAVFVEGKDFQVIGKLAHKLGFTKVSNRNDFAVIPVEGFSPERIRSLINGIETTLGTKIGAMAVLDKDYRSDKECESIKIECESFCHYVVIHTFKEIENFLLVPYAIDRAAAHKVADQAKRTGIEMTYSADATKVLGNFATKKRSYVMSQYLESRRSFERKNSSRKHDTSISQAALEEFEDCWEDIHSRLKVIPGKEALSFLNSHLQDIYSINITPTAIVEAMKVDEIPPEIKQLIENIAQFSSS